MRSRPPTYSFVRPSRLPQAACALWALAGLAGTAPARAAVDDMRALPAPFESAPGAAPRAAAAVPPKHAQPAQKGVARNVSAPARKAAAPRTGGAHHQTHATLEAQRAAAARLRRSLAAAVMDGTWRQDVDGPRLARATAPGSRPAAGTELSGPAVAAAAAADWPLGARWRVVHGDANSNVPSASWMPDMQSVDSRVLPLRPVTNLSGEWALPGDFSVGVMPGVEYDVTAQGRRQANGSFAVTLGKGWSPQWRTFVDMGRQRMGSLQVAGASTRMNAGVSYLAAPGVKIDLALTHGMDVASPPFQAGLGLSSSF